MNAQEARRWAHRLAALSIERADWQEAGIPSASPDRPKIAVALAAIHEQHLRFGPKSTDRVPRPPPGPYATPLLDAADS